jgi:hypothetical protein
MGPKQKGKAHSKGEDGANILPIPPALKFPFPSTNLETQGASTDSPSTSSNAPKPVEDQEDSSRAVSTAVQDQNQMGPVSTWPGEVKTSPRGFMRSRKTSRFGMGMRRTRTHQVAPEDRVWETDDAADSSSASEDDHPSGIKKARTKVEKTSRGEKKDFHRRAQSTRMDDFSKFAIGNENFNTSGKVSKTSGRLDISLRETTNPGYLAKALGSSLNHQKQGPENENVPNAPTPSRAKRPISRPDLWTRLTSFRKAPVLAEKPIPSLNIVVMVIGSRGDIQPFLKIGKLLKERGHRVRIATHPAFKTFVEQDSDLEFFSVGGDPAELMAFMVKNPGLIPSTSTIRAGEIGKKRESMFEMFQGFWRACINATDDEDNVSNLRMMDGKHPFVADAIIANPPSFAHIHCAERLGIPLHLMFTFPYSPTQQFPHPLANIKRTNVDTNYTNFISYPLVEMMSVLPLCYLDVLLI